MKLILLSFFTLFLSQHSFSKEKTLNKILKLKTFTNQRWFYQEIFVKKINRSEAYKVALQKSFAKNLKDYNQRMLFSCIEFNCSDSEIDLNLKSVNSVDYSLYDNISPIFYAVLYNRIKLVKKFLSLGGNPNPLDTHYNPILLPMGSGNWEMFEVLRGKMTFSKLQYKEIVLNELIDPSQIKNAKKHMKDFYEFNKDGKYNGVFDYTTIKRAKKSSFLVMRGFISHSKEYFLKQFNKQKHILGYANFGASEASFYPKYFKGRTIYLFSRPDFSSKLASEFKLEQPKKNFYKNNKIESEMYEYDAYGALIYELKDYWMRLVFNGQEAWVHAAQVELFLPVKTFLSLGVISLKNKKALFDLPNGKMADLSLKSLRDVPQGLKVLEVKYIEGELWIRVMYGEQTCDRQESKMHELWFKPFDENGNPNYNFSPKGC